MLVVSRKAGESVTLTDEQTGVQAVVTIIKIKGSTVSLGIQAPASIQVRRTGGTDASPKQSTPRPPISEPQSNISEAYHRDFKQE